MKIMFLFCGLWSAMIIAFIWSLRKMPNLGDEMKGVKEETETWPLLSIIIPACNEADHIGPALSSLLEQDYPNMEIIAVNDRSTDKTGDILEALANKDPRLKVLHIKELPSGWLGKVNALHEGVSHAKGEWFLFTDADVHFHPGALRRTYRYASHYGVDHVALFPKVHVNSFLLDLSVRTFGLFFLLTTRSALVNRPGSKTPMGIGAFNLVKADTFRQTPGFEWLRLEPGDDYGLGLMINRAGGRTRFALAEDELSITWYSNVREMFKGLEKNLFGPGMGYNWWRLIPSVLFLFALVTIPPQVLLTGIKTGSLPHLLASGTAFAMSILFLFFVPEKGREKLVVLFLPLGILILGLMMLWAAMKCTINGGIDWRGTHYSMKELKKGQRVKF